MDAPDVKLILVPASDEEGFVEEELRHLAAVSAFAHLPFIDGASLGGAWALQAFAIVGPAAGTVLGAWLQSKVGRKVRLKIGPEGLEVEAKNIEELEKLLIRAQDIQQRNQPPKVIP